MVNFFPINTLTVPQVTPFTYRDGVTYLELLKDVTDYTESSSREVAKLIDLINELLEALRESNDTVNAILEATLAQFRNEMSDTLNRVIEQGAAHDPTDGHKTKALDIVLNRVYDYARTHARFASQIDTRELSADDFDREELTARQFDLYPTLEVIHDSEAL